MSILKQCYLRHHLLHTQDKANKLLTMMEYYTKNTHINMHYNATRLYILHNFLNILIEYKNLKNLKFLNNPMVSPIFLMLMVHILLNSKRRTPKT